MYLPADAKNSSILELCSLIGMNSTGDNRTDNLPMMDFIAWPLGAEHRLIGRPQILFTLTRFISGIGSFNYLMWFCGYPMGYGLGENLRQCLISNGKLGTAIISLYCFNMLILGFTIILSVSTSLLWNTGIQMSSSHINWKIVTMLFLFYRWELWNDVGKLLSLPNSCK